MLRWIAGLLSLVVLAGSFFAYTQHNNLLAARAELHAVQLRGDAQLRINEMTRKYAAQQEAKADSAEHEAALSVERALQAEVRLAVATNVRDSLDAAIVAKDAYRTAFQAQVEAAGALRARGDSLLAANADQAQVIRDYGNASEGILKATRPSFLQRLIPKVGVGAAVGVDPINHEVGVVVGPTLSWSF